MSQPGNLYEERKLAEKCTRCGADLDGVDGQLCSKHRAAYVRAKRRFNRGTRRARVAAGKCRECSAKATNGGLCAAHTIRIALSPRGVGNQLGNRSRDLVSALRVWLRSRVASIAADGGLANGGNQVGNQNEDAGDLAIAARSIVQTLDSLAVARAAPAPQRRSAELAALAGVEVALRLGEEVLGRNSYVRERDVELLDPPRRATCAICSARTARTWMASEGRVVPACESCASEVHIPDPPEPPGLRERIVAMLRRSDGMDVGEIAQALGEDDAMSRARISASLKRAIKDGEVSCTGGRMSRTYHWVKR